MAAAPFGELFNSLSKPEKEAMAARLAFRIPVVQHVLSDAFAGEVFIGDYLKPLADSTKVRRIPNVCALFELIKSQCSDQDSELQYALKNVRR